MDKRIKSEPLTIEEWKQKPSTDVVTAGRDFYGLGVSASYTAAKRGDIPTIWVGKKMVVPVAVVLKQLGIE